MTSIEWLIEKLTPSIALQQKHIDELKEQAEEMHRKEILEARQNGLDNGFTNGSWDSNLYYQESFKQPKQ
jgi:hypothetical protein